MSNVQITPGSGQAIAADAITDATLGNASAQFVKLMDGTLGSTNKAIVNSSGQLLVDVGQGNISVGNVSISGGNLTSAGNVTAIVGPLPAGTNVIGALVANQTVSVPGTINVTGNLTNGGNVTISGNVALGAGSNVIGSLVANQTVSVPGTVNVTGNLTNGGAVTVASGNVSVSGNLTSGGNVTVTGGNLTSSGNVSIAQGGNVAVVTGNATSPTTANAALVVSASPNGADITALNAVTAAIVSAALTPPLAVTGSTASDGSGNITSGGTAQNLFGNATATNGYAVYNPNSTGDLWINESTTAAPNVAGSIRVAANGGSYETPTSYKPFHAVSIWGNTTGMGFTARKW